MWAVDIKGAQRRVLPVDIPDVIARDVALAGAGIAFDDAGAALLQALVKFVADQDRVVGVIETLDGQTSFCPGGLASMYFQMR
jgi:hypothetical protein